MEEERKEGKKGVYVSSWQCEDWKEGKEGMRKDEGKQRGREGGD